MRQLAILTFTTLDGVMQAPRLADEDPSGDFVGGWADPHWDEVMPHVHRHAMTEPYDLLLGRKTYDQFAAHHGADSASPMNEATKYVVTSSPATLRWRRSVAVDGNLSTAITTLKERAGPPLQVHGSWQLIQALLAHDLIDEFRLWTFPVLVGRGKRLFEAGAVPAPLSLRRSEPVGPCGVVMSIYGRGKR